MQRKLYNLSHNDRKTKEEIRGIVGKPFGFVANLKMGGSGSPRLRYQSGHDGLDQLKKRFSAAERVNLQVLPKGLILRLNVNTSVYGLVFNKLEVEELRLETLYKTPDDLDVQVEGQWWLKTITEEHYHFFATKEEWKRVQHFFTKAWLPDLVRA
ncbi:MAG: hypothetical protein ACFB10_25565 [Salibacteraceae bacterium]